ncbi:MAG: 6-pyruvoyl-tetrahydropterin synthase-related protein [Terriglobales bacterium]
MGTAFAVIVPFFHYGNASGHDFEFHMNSWMEVVNQWKQGIIHPHWAALAHYGYGEARFIFYPPASWTVGAILGLFLPWNLVPGAYIWIALTLSGCSMFFLARRWLPQWDAVFAAALYAANPYHLVIVYWRSAFAELLAAALLPLLLLFVLQAAETHSERKIRTFVPLGLIIAAAWLTNVPSAVMVCYSLALLAAVVAIEHRSPRVLLSAGGGILLGVGLTAFYLMPVAFEQKWVNISQVLAPGVQPQDNFLFTIVNDPDHNVFNSLVSLVAASEFVVLAGAAVLFLRRKPQVSAESWAVLVWAVVAALFMFSFTFTAWTHFPELRFVQLPWRWLLCLNVAVSLMVTQAWRGWFSRAAVALALLGVVALVWHRVLPPWWDSAGDIAEMVDNQESGKGYEGVDEYVPNGADRYEVKQDARRVEFYRAVTAPHEKVSIAVKQWNAESKSLVAEANRPGTLVLRLFNYPAWKVEVNGQQVNAKSFPVTGQMEIPISAGINKIQLTFRNMKEQVIGEVVSFLTVVSLILFLSIDRRTRRISAMSA